MAGVARAISRTHALIYEEDVANYRQQVLVAFQEVEDNLSDLRILQDQTRTQAEAVSAPAAQRSFPGRSTPRARSIILT